MFFCDATSTEWQNETYERFHAELKHCTRRWGCRTRTSSGGRLRTIGVLLESGERLASEPAKRWRRHCPILTRT